MKRILTILFLFISITAFAQPRYSYTWLRAQDITNTRNFIWRGDTIDFNLENLYLQLKDSTIKYITLKQLEDSIATLAGGHDPLTLGSSATLGGLGITGQELSFQRATSSQSGYLNFNDFINFQTKLSSVAHDSYFTGYGTAASPLKLDTSYVKNWLNNIYLTPAGNLTGTFNGQNAAYYLNYNNFTNTPTISDDAFGISWDASLDLATKNSIYDAITGALGTTTDLTWLRYPTYGIMASSTGAADTIHAVDATYAGLMLPEDKTALGDITVITLSDGLKTVGSVIWTSGLSFDITPALYYITGERYQSGYGSVTLSAADATYSRIDVIALDTLEQAVVIEGTPSANPQKPVVDPTAYVELTYVLVQANATEPSNPGTGDSITNVVVYDENMEWTPSTYGVTVNFDSATDPFNGLKCADVGTIGTSDRITFTAAANKNFADYETFSGFIKLKAATNKQHFLLVEFLLSGVPVSDAVIVLSTSVSLAWQSIAVPMSAFQFSGTQFDAVRFRWSKSGQQVDHAGFYLDFVTLQGGITQPAPTEFQTIATDGTAGNISISNGNTITLNVDDADNDPTNELQVIDTLRIIDNILQISLSDDGEPVKTVGLASYLDNTDNQTAAEVPYTNTTSGLTATDVQAAIDEIDSTVDGIISTGGDGWGTDVVNSDITLSGNGTTGSPLKVDTTLIATVTKVRNEISDSISGMGGDSFWTADTYGINYQVGDVGIGTATQGTSKLHAYTTNKTQAVLGYNTGTTDGTYGVVGFGRTGVYGHTNHDQGYGGYFVADGWAGKGVYGRGGSYGGILIGGFYGADITATGQYGLGLTVTATGTNADGIRSTATLNDFIAYGSGIYSFKERTTSAATPNTDYGALYAKTDGKIYFKNDGGTEYDLTSSGGGSLTLTGEVTGTGTGTVSTTVADNVIDYGNVATTLKSAITDNDGTWDYSAAGVINAAISSNTTVSFTNLQLNKQLKIKLTLSSSAVITWPAYVTVLDGSKTLADGTFYIYADCWSSTSGSEKVLISIVQ